MNKTSFNVKMIKKLKNFLFLILYIFISCSTAPSPQLEEAPFSNPNNIPWVEEASNYLKTKYEPDYQLKSYKNFIMGYHPEIDYDAPNNERIIIGKDSSYVFRWLKRRLDDSDYLETDRLLSENEEKAKRFKEGRSVLYGINESFMYFFIKDQLF